MKNSFITIVSIAALLFACTEEETTSRTYPRVHTDAVNGITPAGAVFNASIIFTSVNILDHGFVWSERNELDFKNADKISLGARSGAGTFSATCDRSLQKNKKYYVRSYAVSADKIVYGELVEFVSQGGKSPIITDFYPKQATWDETVTIVGQNLSEVTARMVVRFGAYEAFIVKGGAEQILVKVPLQLNEPLSSISLTMIGETVTLDQKLQLKKPVIDAITPGGGTPGDIVSITGLYLGGSKARVYFGNKLASLVLSNDTNIQCIVPDDIPPGVIQVRIEAGSPDLSETTSFEVQ